MFSASNFSKIEILSALGQKVHEQIFTGEATISTGLSTGNYLAKITSETKVITKKLVIE